MHLNHLSFTNFEVEMVVFRHIDVNRNGGVMMQLYRDLPKFDTFENLNRHF